MKKALLTAFVIAVLVSSSFAQDMAAVATNPPATKEADRHAAEAKRAREWHNLLVTELKLSDEQVKKWDEMNAAFGERRKAISNNAEITGEVKREKITALLKAKESQFAQLLSEQQQAKYKELVETKKKEAAKKEG